MNRLKYLDCRKSPVSGYHFLLTFSRVFLFLSVIILCGSRASLPAAAEYTAPQFQYPYGSAHFNNFIQDSCNECGKGEVMEFYTWMEGAYAAWRDASVKSGDFPFPGEETYELQGMCSSVRQKISAISDRGKRAQEERGYAAGIHWMIKSIIPRFSLKRGFEFTNVVYFGERQCFLQSVLIASLLQKMGIDAGVVMVYKNEKGEESNNGHAVTLLKLSSGRDILVDASEKAPFAHHRGLFCASAQGYWYVIPRYDEKDYTISSYTTPGGNVLKAETLFSFDMKFLVSQFDFYRGEWAEGGLREKKKNSEGLEQARAYFTDSIGECPENPLPYYYLGRVYEELGRKNDARTTFLRAYEVYSRCGWAPKSLIERIKK